MVLTAREVFVVDFLVSPVLFSFLRGDERFQDPTRFKLKLELGG